MSQQSNLVGQTLGQYQIVELVGEGGMATIYKAWQPSLKRYVAIKVLAPRLSNESEFLKRFHQEAVAAANLKHTHIVTVYDVGVEGDYHYMAMEFIEGTSLQERLRSGQAFTLDEVVDVVSQIGSALDYAHQRGFIHRDIKPANILIDTSGRAVLTDFGIVKALSESGVTSALTQAGTIVGTPQYMSPEQVKDEPLDHRSDLYSLGIVCFEMLSGQVPFDGTTTHAILYAQVNTPPPPLRKFVGLEVPAPVEAAMNKMLAKDRDSRYNSAGEFARDLAQAVAGVWPAGIGGETAVVGQMGTVTAVAGGAAGGATVPATKQPARPPTPPPTVRQVGGPPTPLPAAWQPVGPPTPPPIPAPARRRRSSLALELGIAAGIVLIVGAVAAALVLGWWYPLWSAQDALTAGDYARAAEGFTRVLERNPDQEQAVAGLLEAADNLSQAGQFDPAIAAYETVGRARPEEARALEGLGRAYEAKGAWGEAANGYEKWTQAAPGEGGAFLALGNARFHLEEHDEVVAAYEQAQSLGATSADLDTHLGLAYFELAQYDQAIEHLQRAVEQNPEGFQLRRALGLSLYAQGQFEPAAEHLNEALALGAGRPDGELADLDYVLGDCYFEAQEYEQAIHAYEQAIHLYEQAQALDPESRNTHAEQARANLDEAYAGLAQSVMGEAILDLDFSNVVTEGDETYAIARTGQRVEIGGPVRLVEGPWEGSQALVVEEETTNECKNPSFEIDATYWGSASLGSVARTTDDAWYGDASLRCSSGGGQSFAQACYLEGVTTFNAAVGYAVSAWYKLEDLPPGGNVSLWVHWEGGAQDNAVTGVMVGASEEGGWHYVSAVLAPDYGDRTKAYFCLTIEGATADGQSFLLDGFQIEQGQDYSTSYCDGDQSEACSWSGIPHGSTSARPATAVAVGTADSINPAAGTMALWFRFSSDEISHIRGIWSNHTAADDRLQLFAYWPRADRITLFRNIGSGNEVLASITTTIDTDWHHLAWSWDTSGSRLYLDGSLQATYDGNAWSGVTLVPDMYLGHEVYDPPAYLDGAFATFAVFDRALTAEEIVALYRVDASVSTH